LAGAAASAQGFVANGEELRSELEFCERKQCARYDEVADLAHDRNKQCDLEELRAALPGCGEYDELAVFAASKRNAVDRRQHRDRKRHMKLRRSPGQQREYVKQRDRLIDHHLKHVNESLGEKEPLDKNYNQARLGYDMTRKSTSV
jgi:hypothetical protein